MELGMCSVVYVIYLGVDLPYGETRVVYSPIVGFDEILDSCHRPSESIRNHIGPYPWLDDELLS